MEIILIILLVLLLVAMFIYVVKMTLKYEHIISECRVNLSVEYKSNEILKEKLLDLKVDLDESNNELILCRKRIEELEQQQAQPKQEVLSLDDEIKKMYDMQDKEQKAQYDELMEAWHYNHKKKELVDEQ